MRVKIVNEGSQQVPEYATTGSAGMDIRANNVGSILLKRFDRRLIPTGIKIKIPKGYECQVRPRSGLALKHGVTVLNAPGTIDSDYTGEIGVVLINLGQEKFYVNKGDRIAQLVFNKVEKVSFKEVKSLDKTARGSGGYGHTGK